MIYVDILAELIPIVTSASGGVRTTTRVPDPRPTRFNQLRRVGGASFLTDASSSDVLRDRALVDVTVWGETDAEVWQRAMSIRGALMSLRRTQPLSAQVYSVAEFTGPNQLDETTPGMPTTPRVWLSVEIATRVRET